MIGWRKSYGMFFAPQHNGPASKGEFLPWSLSTHSVRCHSCYQQIITVITPSGSKMCWFSLKQLDMSTLSYPKWIPILSTLGKPRISAKGSLDTTADPSLLILPLSLFARMPWQVLSCQLDLIKASDWHLNRTGGYFVNSPILTLHMKSLNLAHPWPDYITNSCTILVIFKDVFGSAF